MLPSESACNARDPGLTPGSGRSSGEGHGNKFQYSCLENPMDRGAWRAHRVRHDWATNTATMGSTCILGSVAKSCSTLCDPMTAAHQASLPFTISPSLFKLMSTESLMPSNHLILCHPLLLLPSIFLSIRVFSNESVLRIMWLKYSSFSISPSNEYWGLISFRIDWFDLPAVQGTLKSLL